ncbi:hypothetical protein F5H01DRAFT_333155 [Linnemannia elongata]|nr:hypothetical protein F5H01DRAFT_333155 [Linnemannia elongata]
MSLASPSSQGIRSISIGNLTPAPPATAEIVYVDIYTDPRTEQECILWEDIQLAFYNALHVRHKARIVPFVKDSNLETLKPLRIAVIPGEVLDIVVGNTYDTIPQQQQQQQYQYQHLQNQQPSGLRLIEQQAARLPRHDPLSTIRPISSTHPSAFVQNARFAPPGNNFARTSSINNRQLLNESAPQARNKAVAHRYAKEAMKKLAANIDLQALYAKGDGAPGDFGKLRSVT